MAEEIVKYKNDLNNIEFNDFRASELDLFFSICAVMYDKNSTEVELSFSKLRKITNKPNIAKKNLTKSLESMYRKLLTTIFKIQEKEMITYFVLFTKFKIDMEKELITIKANEELMYLINNLETNFTLFEIGEMTILKSAYSKTLYRLLMQYKNTGFFTIGLEKFRALLDVPDSYRMTDIDRQILKPSLEELSKYFSNIKVKKIHGRYNKVERLEFTFARDYKEEKEVLPEIPFVKWT